MAPESLRVTKHQAGQVSRSWLARPVEASKVCYGEGPGGSGEGRLSRKGTGKREAQRGLQAVEASNSPGASGEAILGNSQRSKKCAEKVDLMI